MAKGHTLILGLGNDLLTDDGFGPAVVEAARPLVERLPGVRLATAAAGGFRLLDVLADADEVLIVDVVRTGLMAPGTVLWWPPSDAGAGRTLGAGHGMDLATTLAFGAVAGYHMPRRVDLLVAEAGDVETIGECLTDEVRDAVAAAVREVVRWAAPPRETASASRGGYGHGEGV